MNINIWIDTNSCDSEKEYRVTCKGLTLVYSDNKRAYSHEFATVSLWHEHECFTPIARLKVSRNMTPVDACESLIHELTNDLENITNSEFLIFTFMVECFEAWMKMQETVEWLF